MNNNEIFQRMEQLEKEMAEMKEHKGFRGFLKKSFSKMNVLIGVGVTILATSMILWAAQITFTDDTVISAADVNSNFTELYDKVNVIDNYNTLADLNCSTNQVAMWDGDSWECSSKTIGIQLIGCTNSSCIDTPADFVCPDGKVLVGIELPELGGDEGNCNTLSNGVDDVRFRCCSISLEY